MIAQHAFPSVQGHSQQLSCQGCIGCVKLELLTIPDTPPNRGLTGPAPTKAERPWRSQHERASQAVDPYQLGNLDTLPMCGAGQRVVGSLFQASKI